MVNRTDRDRRDATYLCNRVQHPAEVAIEQRCRHLIEGGGQPCFFHGRKRTGTIEVRERTLQHRRDGLGRDWHQSLGALEDLSVRHLVNSTNCNRRHTTDGCNGVEKLREVSV